MIDANALLAQIERRRLWSLFHKDWLFAIKLAIRPQLSDDYAVLVEGDSVLVSPTDGSAVAAYSPDMAVVRKSDLREPSVADSPYGDVTTAVVEVDEEFELIQQYSLVIRHSRDQRLIAALELISPTNKGVYGKLDREKYLRKRDGFLGAGVNLLEIDALAHGERLFPPSLVRLNDFTRQAWSVLHDDGVRRLRGWGWNDDQTPPTIAWPLAPQRNLVVNIAQTLEGAKQLNPWEKWAYSANSD